MKKMKIIGTGEFKKPTTQENRSYKIPAELTEDIKEPCGIVGSGNAMAPLIPDGSVIFVDLADKVLIENDLYVFHFPATAHRGAENLERDPWAMQPRTVISIHEDGVLVKLENPECKQEFIENAALNVLGRIKLIGVPTEKEGEYLWRKVTSSRTFQS